MARLKTVPFEPPAIPLPDRVVALLDDADERIDNFQFEHRDTPVAAFVPSDFVLAYQSLAAIASLNLAPGRRFMEWGSGVGVVTCLAAMLGYDAIGIEIEDDLVDVSRELASDHAVDAEFVAGSFVPLDEVDLFDLTGDFNWVRTDAVSAYDELDLEPDDFDVVYCYPWPGEEALSEELFAHCCATGSLLLSYHGRDGMRLRRRM
ncbi:class I SAM-dependent methyltransferase [Aeoliella sp.]|uniref:class I SAM-dependent methyltransferase n=1 Tax=Aeoliella sp. TaxID=2795800 RepID=UPI003CCB894A